MSKATTAVLCLGVGIVAGVLSPWRYSTDEDWVEFRERERELETNIEFLENRVVFQRNAIETLQAERDRLGFEVENLRRENEAALERSRQRYLEITQAVPDSATIVSREIYDDLVVHVEDLNETLEGFAEEVERLNRINANLEEQNSLFQQTILTHELQIQELTDFIDQIPAPSPWWVPKIGLGVTTGPCVAWEARDVYPTCSTVGVSVNWLVSLR